MQGSDEAAWAQEPPRRDRLAADACALSRGLALVAAAFAARSSRCWRRAGARPALFEDDEARRAILDLRQQLEQSNEQARARQNEQMTQMSAQIDQLRAQPARPATADRGAARRQRQACAARWKQLARTVADVQRKQTDMQQGVDERMRKVEPQKVTVDGKEFSVDPEEKRSYDEALAGFRRASSTARATGFAGLLKRFPQQRLSPVGAVLARQRAVRAARLQGGDRELPRLRRERARQPARARGDARRSPTARPS